MAVWLLSALQFVQARLRAPRVPAGTGDRGQGPQGMIPAMSGSPGDWTDRQPGPTGMWPQPGGQALADRFSVALPMSGRRRTVLALPPSAAALQPLVPASLAPAFRRPAQVPPAAAHGWAG